jgi:hypothetical protein
MFFVDPVLDIRLSATVIATAATFGVERLDVAWFQVAYLDIPQEAPEVFANVASGVILCRRGRISLVNVALKQLSDGGVRSRLTLGRDLREEFDASVVGLLLGVRPGRDDLLQVETLLGDGVDAGVDPDSQGTAGEHVDAPSDSLPLRS